MSKLAILGGSPVIAAPFSGYNSIGKDELEAVSRVVKSGVLSGFYGSWCEEFYGGPLVKAFEQAWCARFQIKHAVSVNSATSGLFASMGAIGIQPGDEVIVPPYTMSATVTAPLIYGGIPVFADIDPNTFCLDPDSVREKINNRTKAIIAVNLFGHPAPLAQLMSIAEQNGLKLIEDNAQGPLCEENGRYGGTIGHIGVFSLNYHKHIHTGEGGMCVTDDSELAMRLQMIRNHAENIVEPLKIENINNMVGFNYRMTELSAAVGIEQLKKIDKHVGRRVRQAKYLSRKVNVLDGLTPPQVRVGCHHVYYVWALRFDGQRVGVSRDIFSRALCAEGFPVSQGYVRPLYMLPLFQKRKAFGSYPFNLSSVEYRQGMCPVAERMYERELICYETCAYRIEHGDLELMAEAIHKVFKFRSELHKF